MRGLQVQTEDHAHCVSLALTKQRQARLHKSAPEVLRAHSRLSRARLRPQTVKLARQILCRPRVAMSRQRVVVSLDGRDQMEWAVHSAVQANIVLILLPIGLARAVSTGTSPVKQHRARFTVII